jgi:hypothetical protein
MCPDVTLEAHFLAMIEGRSPVGQYRCVIAGLNFDWIIAPIHSGLKIELGASQ